MTTEEQPAGNGLSEKPCKFCMNSIPLRARACHHCGRDQRFLVRHFPVGAIVSIVLLALSIWQFVEARDALAQAREARIATQRLALATSQIILATLAVDKGRFGDSEAKSLTAPYVRRRIETIFDALELSPEERSQRLRVYNSYNEWMALPESTPEKKKAWRKLEALLIEDAA